MRDMHDGCWLHFFLATAYRQAQQASCPQEAGTRSQGAATARTFSKRKVAPASRSWAVSSSAVGGMLPTSPPPSMASAAQTCTAPAVASCPAAVASGAV
jgi:hypothetical protein